MAVEAGKGGAYDYLSKPFELDDLRLVIKTLRRPLSSGVKNYSLRRRIEVERSQRGALIATRSHATCGAMIEKVSETDATCLCEASRHGKELVARELHERNSARRTALSSR